MIHFAKTEEESNAILVTVVNLLCMMLNSPIRNNKDLLSVHTDMQWGHHFIR